MKIALLVVAVILALIALVLIIGARLPRHHVASRSAVIRANRHAVHHLIRNVADAPRWREGVTQVELLDPTRFREHSKFGVVTYEIVEDLPDTKFVTRIADRDLGYSGSWTFALGDAEHGATRLTITEDGEVPNVFFRFMSKFVFGQTSSIEAYLKSVERHFAR